MFNFITRIFKKTKTPELQMKIKREIEANRKVAKRNERKHKKAAKTVPLGNKPTYNYAPVRTAPPIVYREKIKSHDDFGFMEGAIAGAVVGAIVENALSSDNSSYDPPSSSEPSFDSGNGGDFSGGGSSGDW